MHNRFEAYARIYKTALSGMAREKILKGTIRTAVIRNGNTVKTTGLAGGLHCPYKGLLPACARKAL